MSTGTSFGASGVVGWPFGSRNPFPRSIARDSIPGAVFTKAKNGPDFGASLAAFSARSGYYRIEALLTICVKSFPLLGGFRHDQSRAVSILRGGWRFQSHDGKGGRKVVSVRSLQPRRHAGQPVVSMQVCQLHRTVARQGQVFVIQRMIDQGWVN